MKLFGSVEDSGGPLRSTAVDYVVYFLNTVPFYAGPFLIGLIIAWVKLHSRRDRLPARSYSLARSGLVISLVSLVLSVIWNLIQLYIVLEGGRPANLYGGLASLLLSALSGAGLVLLVTAVFEARSPGQDHLTGPYTAADHPQQHPGGPYQMPSA